MSPDLTRTRSWLGTFSALWEETKQQSLEMFGKLLTRWWRVLVVVATRLTLSPLSRRQAGRYVRR